MAQSRHSVARRWLMARGVDVDAHFMNSRSLGCNVKGPASRAGTLPAQANVDMAPKIRTGLEISVTFYLIDAVRPSKVIQPRPVGERRSWERDGDADRSGWSSQAGGSECKRLIQGPEGALFLCLN